MIFILVKVAGAVIIAEITIYFVFEMKGRNLTGLCMWLCLAAGLSGEELSMHEAMSRLLSYGIIREEAVDEQDDSVEILQHYAKLVNEDEDIGEFPYCVRLIEAGGEDNKLPVSCLRPFVKAGATIQGQNGDTSPLQAAAEVGNKKVVSYLLEAGASVHYIDAAMMTALDYALSGELSIQHCEVAVELLRHNALPTPNAMRRAARYHTALLRELVAYGGCISPAVLNAAIWNAESLSYLLENGAYVHGREENGTGVTQALLQRISTGNWTAEELTRLTDILVAYHAPFYTNRPREEVEIMLPEDMPDALRSRLLELYTTPPQPTFPETDVTDVEEVE